MHKIASPQDLQAEIRSVMAYVHDHPGKPDREVVATKLRDLAERVAAKSRVLVGRSPEAVIRSFKVTISEMETDPDYRNKTPLDSRAAEPYVSNLAAHVKEIKGLDSDVARSIGVTLGDMEADIRRRGEIEPRSFGYYIENLQGDLSRLKV